MGKTLAAYSAAHALVDFSCAFLVYRSVLDAPEAGLCLLLYNFCAFALQMPLGLLADGWNRNALVAGTGCALAALAFLPALPAAAACVIAGVGNGLFHVGGGLDVLNGSGDRAGALGSFVSPGALGLYLGGILGREGAVSALVPAGLLLLAGAGLVLLARRTYGGLASGNAPVRAALPRGGAVLAGLLTAVVVLRSYMGLNQALPWKGQGYWGLAAVLALVLGKAAGGFLCDALGARWASLLSLALAAVCYLFADNPAAGTLAVFFFNMTMPVTLWAAARLMPGAKGFAFGLLTFALFLGFLPTWLGWPSLLTRPWAMALAAALSAALLLPGLRGAPVRKRLTGRIHFVRALK